MKLKTTFNNTTDIRHALWLGAVALLLGLLGACTSAVPAPTEAHATRAQSRYPGVTVEGLAKGRSLFVARCSTCHSLPVPASRPAAAWPSEVGRMAAHARLDESERALVEAYVVSVATEKE